MSYAEIASKGPKQTPQEAAAPQPPQIETTTSASTSSLIDVDMPSVRTVPSDFGDQDVQTETQAARLEREEGEKQAQQEAAQQEHHNVGKKKSHQRAKKEAAQVDGWIARRLAALPDGAAAALLAVNLLGVIGLGGFLGYRAWGMYERGRLGWQQIGIGMGVLGAVGAVEGVFTRYFYKAKDIKKQ